MGPGRHLATGALLAVGLVLVQVEAVRGEAVGPPVTVELPELDVRVTRQKFVDPAAGIAETVNELVAADGSASPIADDEVERLLRDEVTAYRARVGAIDESFKNELLGLQASDPEGRVPVMIVPPFDPAILPVGPTLEQASALDDDAGDATALERRTDVQRVTEEATGPLLTRLEGRGVVGARASPLVPLIHAEMRPADVLDLAGLTGDVSWVFEARTPFVLDLAQATCATGATTVQNLGVDADALEVAVVEFDRVQDQTCLDRTGFLGDSGVNDHPTWVAGVVGSQLAGAPGVAPGVNILAADIDQNLFTVSNIEDGLDWALQNGADAYNLSFSTSDSGTPEAEDVMLDMFVRHHRRFIAKSAGNRGPDNSCEGSDEVTSPGIGYNAISVGNTDDGNTCDTSDDVMSTGSCFGDPASLFGDREKPEITAPGVGITTPGFDPSGTCQLLSSPSGTSFSAPHVAGIAALLIERELGLKSWPEAVRAILMAGALEDPDPGSIELDGVGGARADVSDTIVTRGDYDARVATFADFDENDSLTLATFNVTTLSVERIKAAIAWDSNPGPDDLFFPSGFRISSDFDLHLYRTFAGETTIVDASASFDNSYEWIDVADPLPGLYRLEVVVKSGPLKAASPSIEYLGSAWRVVDPCEGQFGDSDGDGICDAVDNCPLAANAGQADTDLDGVGNPCDNCVGDANPDQSDLDKNGAGDACDPDIDGDGCLNHADEDMFSPYQRIGIWLSATCSGGMGIEYGSAAVNTDGTNGLDCEDPDNDGDEVDDVDDDCPVTFGTDLSLCTFFRDCPVTTWFDICQFGGCEEFFVLLSPLVNPVPLERYDTVGMLNRSLYLAPPAGLSPADVAAVLAGAGPSGAAATAAAPQGPVPDEPLLLELWRRDPGTGEERFVALIAEYLPSDVAITDAGPGAWLKVDPRDVVTPQANGLTLRSVWLPGDEEPELSDEDADRIPDNFDNCMLLENTAQEDTDGDRVGNRCDCDFDQDRDCDLGDFNRFLPDFVAGEDSGSGTDMDGDGTVGVGDFNLFLPGFVQGEPGPSAPAALP